MVSARCAAGAAGLCTMRGIGCGSTWTDAPLPRKQWIDTARGFGGRANPPSVPLPSSFTQEAVDAADHLRSVLTKLVAWLDRNGCYGEGEGTEAAEGGGAGQKPVLAVTLGESALKRFLPRECLAAEMKLPAVLQDWVHLRTLFNCHTGLQKLTKAERRAADDDAGRSPVETEAEQMLASSTPWLHPCSNTPHSLCPTG